MNYEEGKWIDAIFVNEEKTFIEAAWLGKDINGEDKEYGVFCETHADDEIWKILQQTFTLDDISKMTILKKEAETEAYKYILTKYAEEQGYYYDVNEQNWDEKIFTYLLDFSNEGNALPEEWLFDLKLRIFDMPEVIASDKDEILNDIRIAENPIKAIYALGKILYE